MRRMTLILVAIACCCTPSFAMWAFIPLDELVQDCDLIVVGTLEGVSQYSHNGMDYGQGTILIDEVVWGAASAGESVTLKWQNRSEIACPRVEHRYNQGKKAIWLLTVEDGGVVRANYPGRFVDLGNRRKVERILTRKNVCLRAAKYLFGADEPVSVSLVFRNPTDSVIKFPGVEYKDGYLVMNPDVSLAVYSSFGDEQTITNPLPNRVLFSDNVEPMLVQPRQELRITVDLRKLFNVVPEEYYAVQFGLRGYGLANDAGFSLEAPSQPKIPGMAGTKAAPQSTRTNSKFELLISSALTVLGASFLLYRRRNKPQTGPIC